MKNVVTFNKGVAYLELQLEQNNKERIFSPGAELFKARLRTSVNFDSWFLTFQ